MKRALLLTTCCGMSFEAVAAAGSGAGSADPAFSDQTASAGVLYVHSSSGLNHPEYVGGGSAGDFDGDGWQDLFVIGGGDDDQFDRLLMNNGDGTFTDRSHTWGLNALHMGKGTAVGDYDGDGDLDLYVTSAGPTGRWSPGHNKLYRNEWNMAFVEVAAQAGVNVTNPEQEDSWGACFGDYDLDGDLDLFVAGWGNDNLGTRLFRNDDGTFTDVTVEIGLLDGVPEMDGFAPGFVDMNGDRFPELLVVADHVSSRYFANDGDGTLTDLTDEAGVGLEHNGMGQAVGDLDGDGLIDWYVTTIHTAIDGNRLYRNEGDHQYFEYGQEAGVDDGGWGWGAIAVDLNHDGLMDLVETNGTGSPNNPEQSYLWINQGEAGFTEMALSAGLAHYGRGRCVIHLDYDEDGDQDVVIVSNNEPLALFRNDLEGPATNWLRVFLDTAGEPGLAPDGYGARVWVTIDGASQVRGIDGANSYLGISELSAHFGLAAATAVDELRVDWPDGRVTILSDVPANQTMTLSPPPPCPADVSGDGHVNVDDLIAVVLAWGPCPRGCPEDVTGDLTVDVGDLIEIILGWGACPAG